MSDQEHEYKDFRAHDLGDDFTVGKVSCPPPVTTDVDHTGKKIVVAMVSGKPGPSISFNSIEGGHDQVAVYCDTCGLIQSGLSGSDAAYAVWDEHMKTCPGAADQGPS